MFLDASKRTLRTLGLLVVTLAVGCSSSSKGGTCQPDDADGRIGGDYTFLLTVDDTQFSSLILKTQNSSNVSLSLENRGTRPHDFQIDCLATPNDDGCPAESCFEAAASIVEVPPGETGTAEFKTPLVEGIYTFRSTLDGDALTGQFVVQ